MSPASKSMSKSKEKTAAKAARDQKGGGGSKPSASTTTASSAYDPVSGTFHSLETSPIPSSPPLHKNGRFQNFVDDTTEENPGSPHGTVSEYDTVSNNGSCSGDSEDNKDKIPSSTPPHRDPVPGTNNDRREKIRLKNEKKHQRQRERRAHELHERCCGYLMSRKLESLSQQLVNMGFSSERATLALILNEGRVEDSVSWLFDGNDDGGDKDKDVGSRGCVKIDISKELSRVGELEAKYKCSKQEVERAVVACEGNMVKAEESLRVQKQDSPLKLESNSNGSRLQEKSAAVAIAQRRSERDAGLGLQSFKVSPTLAPSPNFLVSRTEKRWSGTVPTQPTMAKNEAFRAIGGGEKISQHFGLREPVIMMQRPQPGRQSTGPTSTVNPTGFYPSGPSGVEMLRSNMKLLHSQRLGGLAPESQPSEPFYHHSPMRESNSWSGSGRVHSLAAPPSLGLFSSWRSGGNFGPTSQIDWSTGGLMQEFDYNTIDWTLDTSLVASSKSSGLLLGLSSLLRNGPRAVPETTRSRFTGWQDGGVLGSETPSVGPYEWTSPFAGRDIFSLPRQFVTSPSP